MILQKGAQMNEFNSILFALLRSVLCDENIDTDILESLDEATLEKIYIISKKHDLAHLVSVALEKSGLIIDSDISKKFAKQQMLAIYRYENIKYEQQKIYKTLDAAGISYIPLKGAVIRDLYPEPWMRTSCDIDVLVHEEELADAISALVERSGYRLDDKKGYHDVSLYSASGVHLELHFNIKEGVETLDLLLEKVWNHAAPAELNSHRYDLETEFFVYHTIAHAVYHFIKGGCGIRPVVDLWLMNKNWNYDREKLLQLCEISKIKEFFLAAERLSEVWFSDSQRDSFTDRMEKYLLVGGAYGTVESSVAVKHKTRGGKLGYASSRIFASYDNLKHRYPKLNSKALVPVYQVKRWIDVMSEKRLGRSVQELRTNANIDKEMSVQIGLLMEDLNLTDHIK